MKINYSFFVFLIFLFTKTTAQNIKELINQTNLDNLTLIVNELSGEIPTIVSGNTVTITNRVSNSNNNIAADYIKEKLSSFGLDITDQVYTPGPTGGRNIIATQTGDTNPNDIYIVSAHYDSVTNFGADDNASGTAAIIELARILSQYCTENTIIYALWDQEETGLNGSAYYAQQAKLNGDNILGNFNIDMMAYDADNDNNFDIDVRNIASSLAMKDGIISVLNNPDFDFNLVANIVNPGTGASDHGSFWNNGYSALLFGECWSKNDQTSGYHNVNDRINLFNLPYYHQMSKLVVGYIATVANPIFIDQTITQDGNSLTSNEINASYQWIDCDDNNSLIIGETNQQFTPSVSGNYAVKLSKNNCITYSNCYSVNILNTQNYSIQNLTVFPNPVEGILSIKGIKNNSNSLQYRLLSITGKVVFTKKIKSKRPKLNMQDVNSGVYFLKISSIDGSEKTFKVVKN